MSGRENTPLWSVNVSYLRQAKLCPPRGLGTGPGGSGWGGMSETAALERETPFPAKSSLFINTIMRNVHIPAKPAGHTFTNEPGERGEGSWGLVSPQALIPGSGNCPVKEQGHFTVQPVPRTVSLSGLTPSTGVGTLR